MLAFLNTRGLLKMNIGRSPFSETQHLESDQGAEPGIAKQVLEYVLAKYHSDHSEL